MGKIIDTTTDLFGAGLGISLGSSLVGALPASPVTASVGSGFTRFAGFTPMFATVGAMGIVTHQMMKINKMIKEVN